MSTRKIIQIELTSDEALVLFEWLASTDNTRPMVDPAEQTVLWRIEGQLESILIEPLAPDYVSLLNAARARVNGGG